MGVLMSLADAMGAREREGGIAPGEKTEGANPEVMFTREQFEEWLGNIYEVQARKARGRMIGRTVELEHSKELSRWDY
jgi:hypothetical protein